MFNNIPIHEVYGLHYEEISGRTHSSIEHPYYIGMELEIEGVLDKTPPSSHWESTLDGSLRDNGVEFRFRKPLAGAKLYNALQSLEDWIAITSVSLSERCSTHIHLDVRDLTLSQLRNLLCLSVMLEPLMFRLFGNTRTANTFCLPVDANQKAYSHLCEFFKSVDSSSLRGCPKYSGVSLSRLPSLGTIEYRMFKPILNVEDSLRVINLLHAMKHEATLMDSPQAIVDIKTSSSVRALFSRYFREMVFLDDYEALLERGIQTMNDILASAEVMRICDNNASKYEALLHVVHRQLNHARDGI